MQLTISVVTCAVATLSIAYPFGPVAGYVDAVGQFAGALSERKYLGDRTEDYTRHKQAQCDMLFCYFHLLWVSVLFLYTPNFRSKGKLRTAKTSHARWLRFRSEA